ncbi:DUF6976 family protein [Caldimonas tepidiphila]|uniref:DUF6976 family protein n=1 Tax=Caldimonas tepidiphila TaxID=2315841 RepID=UPI000E5A4686|nr:hypothetical protein [Caldimonas tepidiphila]
MNARNPAAPLPATGALMSVDEAAARLRGGGFHCVAGEEALLRRLPRGRWIGGTIPYFMGQEGGRTTREQVFVTTLPDGALAPSVRWYDAAGLANVCVDAPDNGFSLVIIPAFSAIHSRFAREAPQYEDMYLKPLLGWIAGLHLDDLGRRAPLVVNGETGELCGERAVVMHVPLPDDRVAHLDIVNLFRQGDGDRIRFTEPGFHAHDCLVNGRPVNFADYLAQNGIDTRWPLVADYAGAMVNVSFKGVDAEQRRVDFYAPVFDDAEYRLAAPVEDYQRAFAAAMPGGGASVAWSCNCILNYLYSGLEGQRTGAITGPMTFGEIAYQLLNQTMVVLSADWLD